MNTNTQLLPVGGASIAPTAFRGMSMGMERATRRAVEQVQSRAVIAKLTEDGRSLLTQVALENVGALTALEQHLISIAPLGEARYREIVDNYTLGASAAIRRWQ